MVGIAGLDRLNSYLLHLRTQSDADVCRDLSHLDGVRKRLCFDDTDEEVFYDADEEVSGTYGAREVLESSQIDKDEDGDFDPDDSIFFLTKRFSSSVFVTDFFFHSSFSK